MRNRLPVASCQPSVTATFGARFVGALAACVLLAACGPRGRAIADTPPLKDAFRDGFLVGAAINAAQFTERDTRGVQLITTQFDAISPENVLKWENVHPRPGMYAFELPDRYVAFGQQHGMVIIGHTLVWHSQTPRWVFTDSAGQPLSRDSLVARMRDHILTVVGRYRGKINGWDVVNEALNDDGTLRDSPWRRIIGDDYLVLAYRFAHEADPDAQLYYNDYDLELPAKRAGAVRLIESLRAQGVPLYAVGTQEHEKLDWPSPAAVDSTITALAATGVHVNVTELDVDVLPRVARSGADVSTHAVATAASNPYTDGLPKALQQQLADRYRDLFRVFWAHRDVIDRVTFWGVRDGDSWLNDWPARGRANYPLLFDRTGAPKPAFAAVAGVPR